MASPGQLALGIGNHRVGNQRGAGAGRSAAGRSTAPARRPRAPGDGPAPPGEGRHERIHVLPFDPAFRFKMAVAPVPPALDAQLELDGKGVLVMHVAKGGPADKGGVQDNDILIEAGDKVLLDPGALALVAHEADGKEISFKLLRAGKPLTVTVTPEKAPERPGVVGVDLGPHGKVELDLSDLHDIEHKIRDKLKDAGVDLRMQFIEPGAMLPRGAEFAFGRRTELPDDMSITIHKQGKQPADVEVKQGDKTWNVKENDLAPLPDEVRKHVEAYLGHRPMKFNLVYDSRHDGPRPPGEEGPHAEYATPQPGPRPPRVPGAPPPGGPDGPFPGGDRPAGGPGFRGPDGPGPGERRRSAGTWNIVSTR